MKPNRTVGWVALTIVLACCAAWFTPYHGANGLPVSDVLTAPR